MSPYDYNRPDGEPFGQPPFGPAYGQQYGAPFGQMFGQFGQGAPFAPPFGVPPMAGAQGFQQPPGPPPSYTPSIATAQTLTAAQPGGIGIFAVDPGAIRPCLFRFTFLWLDNGRSFWAWPTFVGRRSLAGFRWTGFRWVYFGIDLDRIAYFVCY